MDNETSLRCDLISLMLSRLLQLQLRTGRLVVTPRGCALTLVGEKESPTNEVITSNIPIENFTRIIACA